MKKTVAILTPSYNRKHTLGKLFKSLEKQSCFDFKWYIIDDGSSDDTKSFVREFETDKFCIEYIYKENGGKHTAINAGVRVIEEELTFIVDSDDFLTPDAIKTIVEDWALYKENPQVGVLSYLKLYNDNTVVGRNYKREDAFIDTYINVRINENVSGDKAEVFKTEALKKHPFPVFEGEKFLSELIIWCKISRDGYKSVFIPKGIYVCEYLEDGLTNAGKKKVFQNPNGTAEHAKSFLYDDIIVKLQWKYSLLYATACIIARKRIWRAFSECPKKGKLLCAYPFGVLLYLYWKQKWDK